MLLHLLLPLGFTVSPLIGWHLQLPWLTLLLAAVILPAAEWWFGRAKQGEPALNYR